MLKFVLKLAIRLDRTDEATKARMKMRRLNVEGIAVFDSDKPFHLSNETRKYNAYLEKEDSRLDWGRLHQHAQGWNDGWNAGLKRRSRDSIPRQQVH